MANLTKKYRVAWEWYTLNITNDYEKDWSGTTTIITDNNITGKYESDDYQDILDKIDEIGLRPPDNWYIPGQDEYIK